MRTTSSADPDGVSRPDHSQRERLRTGWRERWVYRDRPFRGGALGPALQYATRLRLQAILNERRDLDPPIASVSHTSARVGIHLLDLTLRPRHITRLHERLGVYSEDDCSVEYDVHFDLDRLGYQQERALQAASRFFNRAGGDAKPLWVPMLRPIRSTAPPPELSFDGQFIDSMPQRELRPLLAHTLYYVLNEFMTDSAGSTAQWVEWNGATAADGSDLAKLTAPTDESAAQAFARFATLRDVWRERPEVRWRLYEAVFALIRSGLPSADARTIQECRQAAETQRTEDATDDADRAIDVVRFVAGHNRAWFDLLVAAATEQIVVAGLPPNAVRGQLQIRGEGFATVESARTTDGAHWRWFWPRRSQLPLGRPVIVDYSTSLPSTVPSYHLTVETHRRDEAAPPELACTSAAMVTRRAVRTSEQVQQRLRGLAERIRYPGAYRRDQGHSRDVVEGRGDEPADITEIEWDITRRLALDDVNQMARWLADRSRERVRYRAIRQIRGDPRNRLIDSLARDIGAAREALEEDGVPASAWEFRAIGRRLKYVADLANMLDLDSDVVVDTNPRSDVAHLHWMSSASTDGPDANSDDRYRPYALRRMSLVRITLAEPHHATRLMVAVVLSIMVALTWTIGAMIHPDRNLDWPRLRSPAATSASPGESPTTTPSSTTTIPATKTNTTSADPEAPESDLFKWMPSWVPPVLREVPCDQYCATETAEDPSQRDSEVVVGVLVAVPGLYLGYLIIGTFGATLGMIRSSPRSNAFLAAAVLAIFALSLALPAPDHFRDAAVLWWTFTWLILLAVVAWMNLFLASFRTRHRHSQRLELPLWIRDRDTWLLGGGLRRTATTVPRRLYRRLLASGREALSRPTEESGSQPGRWQRLSTRATLMVGSALDRRHRRGLAKFPQDHAVGIRRGVLFPLTRPHLADMRITGDAKRFERYHDLWLARRRSRWKTRIKDVAKGNGPDTIWFPAQTGVSDAIELLHLESSRILSTPRGERAMLSVAIRHTADGPGQLVDNWLPDARRELELTGGGLVQTASSGFGGVGSLMMFAEPDPFALGRKHEPSQGDAAARFMVERGSPTIQLNSAFDESLIVLTGEFGSMEDRVRAACQAITRTAQRSRVLLSLLVAPATPPTPPTATTVGPDDPRAEWRVNGSPWTGTGARVAIRFSVAMQRQWTNRRDQFLYDLTDELLASPIGAWTLYEASSTKSPGDADWEVTANGESPIAPLLAEWDSPVTHHLSIVGPGRIGSAAAIMAILSDAGIGVTSVAATTVHQVLSMRLTFSAERRVGPTEQAEGQASPRPAVHRIGCPLEFSEALTALFLAERPATHDHVHCVIKRHPLMGYSWVHSTLSGVEPDRNWDTHCLWVGFNVSYEQQGLASDSPGDAAYRLTLAAEAAVGEFGAAFRAEGQRLGLSEVGTKGPNISYVMVRQSIDQDRAMGRCRVEVPPDLANHLLESSDANSIGAFCARVESRWRNELTKTLDSPRFWKQNKATKESTKRAKSYWDAEVEVVWRERWIGRYGALLHRDL